MIHQAGAMQRSPSPPRRLRACASCSQARVRCHFRQGSLALHVCDRCEKLGLPCAPKSTASLRRPRRIKHTDERHEAVPSEVTVPTAVATGMPQSRQTMAPPMSPASAGHFGAQTETEQSPPPYGLTWSHAEHIVAIFRDELVPIFPFVIVEDSDSIGAAEPGATAAQQLWREKPLVFRAVILVAASFLSAARTEAVKRDVLARIGQHLLVDDRRSLELLQTLLICIAWADLQSLCDQKITSLTYLALGCAHTLGITKAPPSVMRQLGRAKPSSDLLEDVQAEKKPKLVARDEHSLEEQRAFLGVYFILTINSTQFGRHNPLNDLYVNHCCNRLRWTLQHPTDLYLDRMMRLAQVGDQIHQTFGPSTGSANGNGRHRDVGPNPLSPPFLQLVEDHVTSVHAALDSILEPSTDEAPQEQGDVALLTKFNYYYLLARLYEPATLPVGEDALSGSSKLRPQYLHQCLAAVRSYLELFTTMSASSSLFHALSFATQTMFVTVLATRLLLLDIGSTTSTGESPGWDVESARKTLDLRGLADDIANLLDRADAARHARAQNLAAETGLVSLGSGADDKEEPAIRSRLVVWAEGTRRIRDWIEAKMRGESPPAMPDQSLPGSGSASALETGAGGRPLWVAGMWSNVNWDFDDI